MSWFVVDVEADGPVPEKYSMVRFGAVLVEPVLAHTFYGRTRPVSEHFIPEVLAVSGHSRAEHEAFEDPADVMRGFACDDSIFAPDQGASPKRLRRIESLRSTVQADPVFHRLAAHPTD